MDSIGYLVVVKYLLLTTTQRLKSSSYRHTLGLNKMLSLVHLKNHSVKVAHANMTAVAA